LITRTRFILLLHAGFFVLGAVAIADAGEPATEAYRLAIRMEAQGQYQEARFYYGKVLLHEPNDKRALMRLGLLENRMGDTDSAQVVLDRLQKMCASCPETARLERTLATRTARGKAA
jgi:Flp pilus assembly protein TadD